MSSIQLFGTVFGVIFVAELPDKTALAALVLATRNKALPVFFGAALGLTVQSVIAVAAGSLLARLPTQYVQIGSGALFFICGVLMWIRHPEDEEAAAAKQATGFWRTLWTVFAVVFVAEFGDLTQIGTAAFEALNGQMAAKSRMAYHHIQNRGPGQVRRYPMMIDSPQYTA